MKKIKKLVIGGIQNKIFNLVLLTIVLILLVYGIVIAYQANKLKTLVTATSQKQQASMSDISSKTMDAVIDSSLGHSTALEAYIADQLFGSLQGEVQMLCDYAAKLYASPDEYPAQTVDMPDISKDGEPSVQLLSEKNVDITNSDIADEIGLLGNMSDMMSSLYISSADLNSCFIGTENGVFIIADEASGSKFTDTGEMVDFPVRDRIWYREAKATGKVFFTDIEQDAFSGDIGVVCAMPVYDADGNFVAVVGADLFLNTMAQEMASSDGYDSFSCIINQHGHVVFSPETQSIFKVEQSDVAEDLRKSADKELAEFVSDALNGETGVRLVHTGHGAYYMAGAAMPVVGWTVVSVVDRETVEQPGNLMLQQHDKIEIDAEEIFNKNMASAVRFILIAIGVIFVAAIANALILAKKIVRPLEMISKEAGALNGEHLDFAMDPSYRTGDEIEILADSFAGLTSRTKQYIEEITTITAEKERISAELYVASQIQADMLPRIFPPYPDRKEFDLYASMTPAKEVGGDFYDFFLVDDDHLALVMADVSGKGVPAALFMVIAKTLIKNHMQMGNSPSQALETVNHKLCEGNEAELFVTVWLAVLELSTGKGIAANAGHEHPVLRRADGRYELVKYPHSPMIAMIDGLPFPEHEFEMHPGDSLFVYTDGVAEAADAENKLFGTDRMLDALNQHPAAMPQEILANVMDSVNEFVAGAEQFDDITMLSLRYNGSISLIKINEFAENVPL